jgi:hypothetical protein
MKVKLRACAVAFFTCIVCYGQSSENPCSDLTKLRPNTSAETALDTVIDAVGFDPGTILLYLSHDDFVAKKGGAMSLLCNSTFGTERWIVYDPDLIKGDPARSFAFAHEIGHLVNNHALTGGRRTKQEELQADYYAAQYLARLSWTQDQLLDALIQLNLPSLSEGGYPTLDERRAAVTRGFVDEKARMGRTTLSATNRTSAAPAPANSDSTSPISSVLKSSGLVLSSDGKDVHPAAGYEWVNPSDPNNKAVKLKAGLILDQDGTLAPARGYEWVDPNNPNGEVKLKVGLYLGSDGKLQPTAAYDWVYPDDKDSLEVKLKPGLIKDTNNQLHPAPGYDWVDAGDKNNISVRLKIGLARTDGNLTPSDGYEWVNPTDSNNLEVRPKLGLIQTPDGKLQPAGGYEWVNENDPNDHQVQPRHGLIQTSDGKLQPAPGYDWVNENDPNNYEVKSIGPTQ